MDAEVGFPAAEWVGLWLVVASTGMGPGEFSNMSPAGAQPFLLLEWILLFPRGHPRMGLEAQIQSPQPGSDKQKLSRGPSVGVKLGG